MNTDRKRLTVLYNPLGGVLEYWVCATVLPLQPQGLAHWQARYCLGPDLCLGDLNDEKLETRGKPAGGDFPEATYAFLDAVGGPTTDRIADNRRHLVLLNAWATDAATAFYWGLAIRQDGQVLATHGLKPDLTGFTDEAKIQVPTQGHYQLQITLSYRAKKA